MLYPLSYGRAGNGPRPKPGVAEGGGHYLMRYGHASIAVPSPNPKDSGRKIGPAYANRLTPARGRGASATVWTFRHFPPCSSPGDSVPSLGNRRRVGSTMHVVVSSESSGHRRRDLDVGREARMGRSARALVVCAAVVATLAGCSYEIGRAHV